MSGSARDLKLNPASAYRFASMWAGWVNADDPGLCFGEFYLEDGRPNSQEHREACIDYTVGLIHTANVMFNHWYNLPGNFEMVAAELHALHAWFLSCDLRPAP